MNPVENLLSEQAIYIEKNVIYIICSKSYIVVSKIIVLKVYQVKNCSSWRK